jgi:hypothetical protein
MVTVNQAAQVRTWARLQGIDSMREQLGRLIGQNLKLAGNSDLLAGCLLRMYLHGSTHDSIHWHKI